MDISAALAALSQATTIVKALRSIDKSYDLATAKAQMAEVYSALADVKIALSDAREVIHARDHTIRALEAQIAVLRSGEACPLCDNGKLKVVASRPHPDFAFAGVQERTIRCDACGHSEKRFHDPGNVAGLR